MPKLSRDQLFQKSYNDFMVSISDLYYPDMKEWKLEGKTPNKNQTVHTYKFTIPRKIVLCEIDAEYIDENGVKQQPGVMYTDQQVPELRCFVGNFGSYFNTYALERDDRIISFTALNNPLINEEGNLVSDIIVCYATSYIPYPTDQLSNKQTEERCKQLEQHAKNMEQEIHELTNIVHMQDRKLIRIKRIMRHKEFKFNNQLGNTIYRMQEKIRELYDKLGEKAQEDCPVCYEKIDTNGLVVPGCSHFICAGCNERCNKCPICREDYVY